MLPGLVLLFVSGSAIWYGFANPQEGFLVAVRNLIDGRPASAVSQTERTAMRQASTLQTIFGTGAGAATLPGGRVPDSADADQDALIRQQWADVDSGARPNEHAGAAIVREAEKYLGTPYKWGGRSKAGFDCAGFVHYVAAAFGEDLPWWVGGQLAKKSAWITVKSPAPGDVVFFGVHHVGIAIGGGQMIHSPKPGTVVRREAIKNVKGPYQYRRLKKAHSS